VAYQDRQHWLRMSTTNSAKSGRFSTVRTMQEYNQDIWRLQKVLPDG
jgi:glycogen phosphorylase